MPCPPVTTVNHSITARETHVQTSFTNFTGAPLRPLLSRGCVRRAIAAFAQFVHTVCSLDAREMQREDQELQPSPACSTMGDAYPSRAGISLSSHRIITGLQQLAGRKEQPCRAADP